MTTPMESIKKVIKDLDYVSPETLVKQLRDHVWSRNGLSNDENGDIILPNGAWAMMLRAADLIEELADYKFRYESCSK